MRKLMSEVKTITELFDYLPHRYPFLLLDRVTELTKGESIKGFKNVTVNEEMFNGHFPGSRLCPVYSFWNLWHKFLVS